jgi:2-succinyl-6-hydroxy-2,4-cyclohexadiene-1-carboxylate synthase
MPLYGRPGEQIYYEVTGSGPPLVLLHGFTTDSRIFSENVAELGGEFAVVTVDLLGHGQSDAPPSIELYGPGPTLERITGLLDSLGADFALFVGHALGGTVALRLAIESPERVAGVVMINSSSAAGGPAEQREQLGAFAESIRTGGVAALKGTRLNPERATRLPEPVRARLVQAFESLNPIGVANTVEALIPDISANDRLGNLQVPVLIVVGELDAEFNESVFDLVAEMPLDLANAVTLEETGHAGHIEEPEAFNAVVVEFAREIQFLAGDEVSGE